MPDSSLSQSGVCFVHGCGEAEVGDAWHWARGWLPVCARHYDQALTAGERTRLLGERTVGADEQPTAETPSRGRA